MTAQRAAKELGTARLKETAPHDWRSNDIDNKASLVMAGLYGSPNSRARKPGEFSDIRPNKGPYSPSNGQFTDDSEDEESHTTHETSHHTHEQEEHTSWRETVTPGIKAFSVADADIQLQDTTTATNPDIPSPSQRKKPKNTNFGPVQIPPKQVSYTSYSLWDLFSQTNKLNPDTVMMILGLFSLLSFIFSLLALTQPWGRSVTIDAGTSGVAIWRDVTAFTYSLRGYYDEVAPDDTIVYMGREDFRSQCGRAGKSVMGCLITGCVFSCVIMVCCGIHTFTKDPDKQANMALVALVATAIQAFLLIMGSFAW